MVLTYYWPTTDTHETFTEQKWQRFTYLGCGEGAHIQRQNDKPLREYAQESLSFLPLRQKLRGKIRGERKTRAWWRCLKIKKPLTGMNWKTCPRTRLWQARNPQQKSLVNEAACGGFSVTLQHKAQGFRRGGIPMRETCVYIVCQCPCRILLFFCLAKKILKITL